MRVRLWFLEGIIRIIIVRDSAFCFRWMRRMMGIARLSVLIGSRCRFRKGFGIIRRLCGGACFMRSRMLLLKIRLIVNRMRDMFWAFREMIGWF